MADTDKPVQPGPIEQSIIDQARDGWYARLDDYKELARLSGELRRHKHVWRAVNNGEKPPSWANLVAHGVPVVVGNGLVHGDVAIEALQLLRDAIQSCHGDVPWRARVREFLREQMADKGLT